MSIYKKLKYHRWFLLVLDFLIVLAYGLIMVFASHYAIAHELSLDLLAGLERVPSSPWKALSISIVLYWVLAACLLFIPARKERGWYAVGILVLAFGIILEIQGVWNGLILTVFCFFLPAEQSTRTPWTTITICLILFIFSQYDVISLLLPLEDFAGYISIFSRPVQRTLNITLSLASTINLAGFMSYLSIFLLDQYQRAQNVEKELEMMSAVNTELQNYAAITEKIGEDKERKRLAREIHDTLGHALTGIAAGVDACLVLIDMDPGAAKKQLQIVSRVVRQGIGDVRNSLNKLRPGALEESSFRTAIEKMIREFMEVSSLLIHFDYKLEEFDFEGTKEDMLYRIVQESITNALRHGHAKEIWISMYSDASRIILSIRDDGIGCETVVPGYGLKQMKERVAMMGGQIFHDGTAGFMTIVNLPVEKGESIQAKKAALPASKTKEAQTDLVQISKSEAAAENQMPESAGQAALPAAGIKFNLPEPQQDSKKGDVFHNESNHSG